MLGTMIANQIHINKEDNSRINSGNAFSHLIQNLSYPKTYIKNIVQT
jgi:hypothetical protein